MTTHPKYGFSNSPFYYLGKYHDWGWCCASHLLDLVNIGGLAFSWEDYPEVWARTERLLKREPRMFGTAKNMDVDTPYAVTEDELSDGFMESYE